MALSGALVNSLHTAKHPPAWQAGTEKSFRDGGSKAEPIVYKGTRSVRLV